MFTEDQQNVILIRTRHSLIFLIPMSNYLMWTAKQIPNKDGPIYTFPTPHL